MSFLEHFLAKFTESSSAFRSSKVPEIPESATRKLTYINWAFWVVYALLAYLLTEYRYFRDAAYYLFKIVNAEWFNIEHNRFIGTVSQGLVVWANKQGIDLPALMVIYSLSDVLYYFVLFLFIRYYLKDVLSATILPLMLLLGLTFNYFNPISELIQAAGLLVALVACWRQQYFSILAKLIYIPVLFTLNWGHPLISVLLLICIAYFIKDEPKFYHKHLYQLGAISAAFTFIHYLNLGSYESNLGTRNEFFILRILDFINPVALIKIAILFLKRYFVCVAIAIFTFWALKQQAKKRTMLFLAMSLAGLLFMVQYKFYITGPDFDTIERYLFPLTFVLAMVFVWDALPFALTKLHFEHLTLRIPFIKKLASYKVSFRVSQPQKVIFAGILFIFIACFGAIIFKAYKHIPRLQQIRRWLSYTQTHYPNHGRFLIRKNNINRPFTGAMWSVCHESLLLSSWDIHHNAMPYGLSKSNLAPQQIGYFEELDSAAKYRLYNNDEMIYAPWWIAGWDMINKKYFPMRGKKYLDLNTPLEDSLRADFFKNIAVYPLRSDEQRLGAQSSIPVKLWGKQFLDIEIINKNRNKIPSLAGKYELMLAYEWINDAGKVSSPSPHIWDASQEAVFTPLEVDVIRNFKQTMEINTNFKALQGGHLQLGFVFKIPARASNNNTETQIFYPVGQPYAVGLL